MTQTKTILKYIGHKDFFKFYSRNSSVQIAENFAYYCMLELKRLRGIYLNHLTINSNEFIDVYTTERELMAAHTCIKRTLEQSRDIKQFFEADALPIFKAYSTLTKKMQQKYVTNNFNSRDLLADYTAFTKINATFIAFNLFIYLSDHVIDKLLREMLLKYLKEIGEEKRTQELLVLVSTPLRKPAIIQEHMALLLLATKRTSAHQQKALMAHADTWGWFPCYNPCNDPYTVGHYAKELVTYTPASARSELHKIKSDHRRHRSTYKKFVRSIQDKQLRKLVQITNMVCFYREYRNDVRREGLYRIRPLYERIGKKLDINIKEVCYLTNAEVKVSLQAGKAVVPKEQIRRRFKKYVIFTTPKQNVCMDDITSVDTIIKAIKEKAQSEKVIKGLSVFGGLVKGMVRVVSHIGVLKNFKPGEIMVASMTAPEYVPAMKKTAAIVTDEGGITCHAAVIARELGIPCVVGTKIATKALKDGDMVEVDAQRGMVHKLQS